VSKIAAILFLLCLCCASAQAAWVKDGATAKDLKRDQSECERKARADTAFYNPPPMGGAGVRSSQRGANNAAKEMQAFGLCMKSRGYAESSDK
jgi:hypothetical protein